VVWFQDVNMKRPVLTTITSVDNSFYIGIGPTRRRVKRIVYPLRAKRNRIYDYRYIRPFNLKKGRPVIR
jgi:hypothetical protein